VTDSPLRTWLDRDDQVLRLQLARPKANIIDADMIDSLSAALSSHADDERLMAVLIDAEGPHFSFGASVEEHLPDQCAGMLRKINALIVQMLEYPLPIVAAVKGQCLGGGLEVACAATPIVAAPGAMLGQPEISLAVIAPAASCLLPERIGQAQAEMLLLSGKSIDADRAKWIGLVDEISEMPTDAALAWIDENLIGKSASSLRIALSAARHDYVERIKAKLDAVEKIYMDVLMQTRDPLEGLTAFLEKRAPVWENSTKGADG
jgi:cyclohexa-1,5-dienecarbonyl-CoA hydratase